MKKRVVIDASSIFPWGGSYLPGIGRATLELIKALEKVGNLPFELVLFGQRLSRERFQRYNFSSQVRYLPLPRWKCLSWVRKRLPIVEMLTGADLLHIPHNYAPVFTPHRTIVTIHDAMFLSYPENHLHNSRATRDILRLAETCKAIITSSCNSRNDLAAYGGIDPEKVHVLYLGYDKSAFYQIQDEFLVRDYLLRAFRIVAPYFLCVSCDIGRKNSPAVVENFLELAKRGERTQHLVMVWRNPPDNVLARVENSPFRDRVHLLANVSDENLRYLYNGATALLFPSEYEGFGLPVLEAMACGTPVVTCKVSSLPEVGGDAAIYINPGDHDALLLEMQALSSGGYDRNALRRLGVRQASKFSWEKYSDKISEVYCNCLEGSS